MSRPVLIRPGGRSERIQRAVHEAVKALKTEHRSENLTVPMIAQRAGVTPSTIYRRWSTLAELLDAVAADSFHADRDPPNTGTFSGDLTAWVEGFVDDIASALGKSMLLERVANPELSRRTAGYAFSNLRTLARQAEARGEAAPDPDRLMDLIVAPIVYRLIFAGQEIGPAYRADLVQTALLSMTAGPPAGQPSYAGFVIYNEPT